MTFHVHGKEQQLPIDPEEEQGADFTVPTFIGHFYFTFNA
jgi:hypothetical protein